MDRLHALYIEQHERLYRYFYMRTSDAQTAEDLTHDVFYEASKSMHTYRGDASLTSWIYSIAHNLLRKYYRSKRYERQLLSRIEQPQVTDSMEQTVEQKWAVEQLQQRIGTLPEEGQQLVVLRLYSELSFKEIADIMGVSENYARVQFHRYKQKLKREE